MSFHEENARKQNHTYLDQSRRNALTPLNLGIFDDTSLRLLEGEFRNGKPWQGRIIDKYCEILELKGFSCHDGIVENGVFKKNPDSLKTIIQKK